LPERGEARASPEREGEGLARLLFLGVFRPSGKKAGVAAGEGLGDPSLLLLLTESLSSLGDFDRGSRGTG